MEKLIVNGCSYMDAYTGGRGHIDLAARLNLPLVESIAVSGCNNSRIIRSTIKHSYSNPIPTLYVVGMTFFSRWELPVKREASELDGHWTNPQSCPPNTPYLGHWNEEATERFKTLMFDAYACGFEDSLEDLMYRMVAMVSNLKERNHRILIYNQVEREVKNFVNDPRFSLLKSQFFVDQFAWPAIIWQHENQVPEQIYPPNTRLPPPHFRHRLPGEHDLINQHLTDYIVQNKILE